MNCELIFYYSTKTNLCEKALKKSLNGLDLNFQTSRFATSPEKLGELVIDVFEKTNVVFVTGGFTGDKNSIENVLSKVLATKTPDDLKKLRNPLSSHDGYLIRQGGQLLIVLPDEPNEIDAIMSGPLRKYIQSFCEF
ncbi:MAG: hypothetical protein K6F88_01980 [Ruminococcus sp.]|nr:hypothetical protein [Ruminococcus sp.]